MQEEIKDVIKQISKMIASGEIPNEVYDKYLSKCPIGFMNENDLFNYLTADITNLQEENEKLNLIIRAIKKQCEVWQDYEMSEFIKQLENEKEISNWLKRVAGVDKE